MLVDDSVLNNVVADVLVPVVVFVLVLEAVLVALSINPLSVNSLLSENA